MLNSSSLLFSSKSILNLKFEENSRRSLNQTYLQGSGQCLLATHTHTQIKILKYPLCSYRSLKAKQTRQRHQLKVKLKVKFLSIGCFRVT